MLDMQSHIRVLDSMFSFLFRTRYVQHCLYDDILLCVTDEIVRILLTPVITWALTKTNVEIDVGVYYVKLLCSNNEELKADSQCLCR
jgi:hypothetical protein